MNIDELAGTSLGTHTRTFTMRDALLYNLAAGARADELELTYERHAGVLPTYANALGTWAVEACGDLGAYDRVATLHASQQLDVREPLEPGDVEMTGVVEVVWDKGKAALVVIAVEASAFIARYTIFVPGAGGWGGDRGPSTPREAPPEPSWHDTFHVPDNLAALYRLTGDEHPVHIDPVVAESMGFPKPILHGLCTLAITARATAAAVGKSPLELRTLDLRFAQPVFPGDDLFLWTFTQDGRVTATVATDAATVLSGTLRYGDGA